LPKTSNSSAIIVADDITVELGGTPVLDNVSFSIDAGSLVGLVGPNGGGKSTLFNTIVGMIQPLKGSLLVAGHAPGRVKGILAYVPQRELVNWRFPLSVQEVVGLGRTNKLGWLRRQSSVDKDMIRASLERVDMWNRRDDLVSELSGGQRQRVFIARALAQEAEIFLLDEAFSGVDVASQEGLVSVLRGLRDDGKTIVMATHDLTNLSDRFDRVLCLNRHVCAWGPPQVAFTPAVLEELYGAHGVEFGSLH